MKSVRSDLIPLPKSCEVLLAEPVREVYESLMEKAEQELSPLDPCRSRRSFLSEVDQAFEQIAANPGDKKTALVGKLKDLHRMRFGRIAIGWLYSEGDHTLQIVSLTEVATGEQNPDGLYAILSKAVSAGEFDSILQSIGAQTPAREALTAKHRLASVH